MNVELYNVEISGLSGTYCYYKDYLVKHQAAKKLIESLQLTIELLPVQPAPTLEEGEKDKYGSWAFVDGSSTIVLTDKQLVKLAVSGVAFKVLHPINVELEDISLPFRTIEGKTGEQLGSVSSNTYNNKCDVHMPGNMMASYNELMLVEDSCSDVIQTHLSSGWRLVAVCPQPDQRRPDYILGRFNPTKEIGDSAARG